MLRPSSHLNSCTSSRDPERQSARWLTDGPLIRFVRVFMMSAFEGAFPGVMVAWVWVKCRITRWHLHFDTFGAAARLEA
jgi:hypothetical protein